MNTNPKTFTVHTSETAPAASRPILDQVQAKFGFVPHLFGVFAESPAALTAYATLNQILQQHAALTPQEQQVVMLTVSTENGCGYCVAAHTAIATKAGVKPDTINALREQTELTDARSEALRQITLAIIRQRGWLSEDDISAFFAAGFQRQHLLDVLVVVITKTLSNYTNHIAETPLDSAFAGCAWQAPQPVA